jgi:WD40 repeat protein
MPTGLPLASLTGHGDTVCRIAFSPDGKMLISSSSDRTLKVWGAGPALDSAKAIAGVSRQP